MSSVATAPLETSRERNAAPLCLGLGLALTALTYLNALGFQFVYDDWTLIARNPQVQSWGNVGSFFTRHLWSSYAASGSYYRPVYQLWLLGNYSAFGLHPLGWHAAALAAHLGATFLVYRLMERLGVERLAAALAATVFGVHPAHLEGVAWVSGAIEPVTAIFFVGAFLCHLRARELGRWWWAAALVLYALAVLNKESAGPLPAVVFVYEWLFSEQDSAGLSRARRLTSATLRAAPYAAVTLLYLLARFHWQVGLGESAGQNPRALWLTLPAVLVFYLRHLVWPSGLSIFYHLPLVERPGMANFLAPALLVAGVAAATIWASLRSRTVAFAAAWFALTMLPPIAGLPVFPKDEIVHDRYLYLPSVAAALLLGWGLTRWRAAAAASGARVARLGVAGLACALATLTLYQGRFWSNNLALFTRGVEVAPGNVNANDQLANELFRRGRGNEALELYRRALRLDPGDWATNFSLGFTEFMMGRYADAQADLQRAIQVFGGNVQQYYYLGLAQMQQGQWREAELPLRRAAELAPAAPGVHYALGVALAKQGQLQAARKEFSAELKLDPNFKAARQGLAEIEKQAAAP